MKKYVLSLLVLFTFSVNAQIQFENSLQNAFTKAKKENKLVFIEYYNSECTICQQVNPLLDTKEIGAFYNKHFISYKLNTNDDSSESDSEFLKQKGLHIEGVPNFVFFDKDKNFVHFSGVNADLSYILQIGQDALNPDKRWSELPQQYKNGNRRLLFLYEYSSYAQLFKDTELANILADQMYEVFPKENLANISSYRLLKNAVFTTQNGFFEFWIKNQDKLNDFEGAHRTGTEKEQLDRIIALDLNNSEKKWTSQSLATFRKYMELARYSDNIDMLLWEKELNAFVDENKTTQANMLLKNIISQNIAEKESLIYIIAHYMKTVKNKENINFAKAEIRKLLSANQNSATQKDKDFVNRLNGLLK